jgi:hypothetical protein
MSDDTFRWVIAGGVLMAALSFVVMGIVSILLLSIAKKLKLKVDPILDSARPVAQTVSETVAVFKPRALKISHAAVEISELAVKEAHRYSDLSKDVAERAKAQIARLDGAVDETLEHVQDAGGAAKKAVMRPVREVEGVLVGLRAAILTFSRGNRRTSVSDATQDEEMFI